MNLPITIKPLLARLEAALSHSQLRPVLLAGGNPLLQDQDLKEATCLVVGYTGSPNSQAALDLALWIAHQTRMATHRTVAVHVVYVSQPHDWAQADAVLSQAQALAEEWRGSFCTHLRCGMVADELSQVAMTERADLLLVGCHSDQNTLVQQLSRQSPCPLLGVPLPLVESI